MTCLVTEELSPGQIGPAMTRMSAGRTFSRYRAGQSSVVQPCSVMSGQTPVAMSWSTARITSTATPCCAMMAALTSTRPWVWDSSGERLRVQLMNSARRSSYLVSVMSSPFCPGTGKTLPACGRAAEIHHRPLILAYPNRCPHQGGPLGEGSIENGWLRCPWHGAVARPADLVRSWKRGYRRGHRRAAAPLAGFRRDLAGRAARPVRGGDRADPVYRGRGGGPVDLRRPGPALVRRNPHRQRGFVGRAAPSGHIG